MLRKLFIVGILCISNLGVFNQLQKEKPLLQTGTYMLKATFKLSDSEQPLVNLGGESVVIIEGTKMTIKVPVIAEPITVKIKGESLKGKLERDGANIEFEGDIIEKDHVEGIFRGELGKKRVYGIWSLKPSTTKDNSQKS
jgi:hypothetical protein